MACVFSMSMNAVYQSFHMLFAMWCSRPACDHGTAEACRRCTWQVHHPTGSASRRASVCVADSETDTTSEMVLSILTHVSGQTIDVYVSSYYSARQLQPAWRRGILICEGVELACSIDYCKHVTIAFRNSCNMASCISCAACKVPSSCTGVGKFASQPMGSLVLALSAVIEISEIEIFKATDFDPIVHVHCMRHSTREACKHWHYTSPKIPWLTHAELSTKLSCHKLRQGQLLGGSRPVNGKVMLSSDLAFMLIISPKAQQM